MSGPVAPSITRTASGNVTSGDGTAVKADRAAVRFQRRVSSRSAFGESLRLIVNGRGERIVVYLFLVVLGITFLFPLYGAVVASLQVNGFESYIRLFTHPLGNIPVLWTYVNSFVVGLLNCAFVLFISATAGYAFSKLSFPGREVLFAAVLLFLAIPGISILVPVYSITQQLGLFNNYVGVALPQVALTVPFGILIIRNYGRSVPDSLMEAAQLDGAGHLRIFWNVFLPLTRPALANLGVLSFIWSLQDFLWPSFFFTDPRFTTAAQAVQTLSNSLGRGRSDLAEYNASLVLLAIPAALVVLFGLRFFVAGLTAGATKE